MLLFLAIEGVENKPVGFPHPAFGVARQIQGLPMAAGSCDNNRKVPMTITLRPEQEELIAQVMQTGAYQSPNEVIERALRMLYSDEEWLVDHQAEITEKIERAFGQFERGGF
jgi:putative addiction module CopG family antidote